MMALQNRLNLLKSINMKKLRYKISFVFIIGLLPSQTVAQILISGVFNMYKETVIEGSGTQNRNVASAYFSNSPVSVVNPSLYTNAGNVKLNGKKLKKNNGDFYATKIKKNNNDPDDDPDEFCNTSAIDPMHWDIKGKNNVPRLNFIYSGPFPVFSNAPVLPTTLKLSDTLFVPLNDVSDCDSVRINIWNSYFDGSNRKYVQISVGYESIPYLNGNKFFYIVPELLTQLTQGNASYISIEAVNSEYQVVEGKNFLFNTITSIIRPVITITN